MKKSLSLLTLLLAGVLCAPLAPAASPKVLKFSYGDPDNHFVFKALEDFKAVVEQQTGGSLKIDLFPNAQLGNDREVLESLLLGQAEMVAPSPAVFANFVKPFNVLTFPFLFPTAEIADAFSRSETARELYGMADAKGFVCLGIGAYGFRHVTNSKRAIEKIDDFKGLKIRTMENRVHLDAFRALGANPTAMGWSEVLTGLQQGTIDGQENPLPVVESVRLYEVQKYLSKTGHVYDWVVFVVRKSLWDTLTDAEKSALREGAAKARDRCAKDAVQADIDAEKHLKDDKLIAINEISRTERDKMEQLVRPVLDKYIPDVGKDFYRKVQTEIQTLRAGK
jgi:tripartite ATP-independent transporter DctP family solute receptor